LNLLSDLLLSELGIQSVGLGLEGFLGILSGSDSSSLGFLDRGSKFTGGVSINLGLFSSRNGDCSVDVACCSSCNDLDLSLFGIIE